MKIILKIVFLEELNKKKNIDIMFSNISWKYTLYYSDMTGNDKDSNNNIIWYNIAKKYSDWLFSSADDKSESHVWLDIYNKFSYDKTYYNIENVIRNEYLLWWDGTVPTNNLILSSNDTNEILFNNDKFESVLIKCYKDWDIYSENDLVLKLWKNNMDLCAHSKMPMLTSVKVFEKISWKILIDDRLLPDEKIKKEQELLYSYLWYTEYKSNYVKKIVTNNNFYWKIVSESNVKWWIKNDENITDYFATWSYMKVFPKQADLDDFLLNRSKDSYDRKTLDFWWKIWQTDSLIRYEILSPINLIIEDELWRKVGIDPESGMIINEIPWAWTSWDTEWSNEPEFFLIPKYGTGQVLHKIHSYGTWDWEYHIVMQEIKDSYTSTWKLANFVIAWEAKKWIVEDYLVWVEKWKANYKKIDSYVSDILKKVELKDKYKDILEKLYILLDTKYTKKQKLKLKDRLIKFREAKNPKFKDNEKINFLVDMIIEYIR